MTDCHSSGDLRYRSNSWGPFVDDGDPNVRMTGVPLAKAVHDPLLDSGDTDETFARWSRCFAGLSAEPNGSA
jgi:hypothetical protein